MAQRKISEMPMIEAATLDLSGHRPLVPALGASAEWLDPQEKYLGLKPQLIHVNGELTGRFPVWLNRWRYGFPLPVLTNWLTPLTFTGTPYVREDRASETIGAFLTQEDASAFLLTAVPASGPFWDRLISVAGQLEAPFSVVARWRRAAIVTTGNYEKWFETNFERKRKKEHRRMRSRLAEAGDLRLTRLARGEKLDPWIDRLIALEANGWKGRRGTALDSSPELANCLRDSLNSLHAEGNVRFWNLSLDGRPLATMFAVVEGAQAWLGKIAFDEDFARFSPGVLLVLDATRDFFADPGIEFVDSCAIPDHPMIDRLWRDRLELCDVLIGRPGMAPSVFGAIRIAENFRRGSRKVLKELYYRLSRRRRS
jgi:hypothetical protein